MSFEASEIIPDLYQGSNPLGVDLRAFNFDLVVCLSFRSTSKWGPPGALIWYPIPDGPVENGAMLRILGATVARAITEGKRVLVHCDQGLNRSGIVVAQALKCLGYATEEAIDRVRAKRDPNALFNNDFVRWLRSTM